MSDPLGPVPPSAKLGTSADIPRMKEMCNRFTVALDEAFAADDVLHMGAVLAGMSAVAASAMVRAGYSLEDITASANVVARNIVLCAEQMMTPKQ